MQAPDTVTRILDVAQELLQTRGFNAFSYKDLEARVGIRTASIHYHFPTKGDLGVAIVKRYREFVNTKLAEFELREIGSLKRLQRYSGLLESVLTKGSRICVGGMLASDFATLPAAMQVEVTGFIADNERWLARMLREGRSEGALAFDGSPDAAAATLFSALEGAMFMARGSGDLMRYRRTSEWLLGVLAAPRATAKRR